MRREALEEPHLQGPQGRRERPQRVRDTSKSIMWTEFPRYLKVKKDNNFFKNHFPRAWRPHYPTDVQAYGNAPATNQTVEDRTNRPTPANPNSADRRRKTTRPTRQTTSSHSLGSVIVWPQPLRATCWIAIEVLESRRPWGAVVGGPARVGSLFSNLPKKHRRLAHC